MRNEDALLFLSYLNFDYKIKDELLNHFTLEHIEEIFDLSGEYFKENKLLTKNNIEKLVEERKKFNSDAYRDFLEKKKVKYVSILSENYPINLKDIEFIPQVIYYKGDILPEDEFALSFANLEVISVPERSCASRFANEQSKEIFALPGNINSLYSRGTNKLIKDGALIATDYQDIIDGVIDFSEFILNKNKEEKDLDILDAKELLIYNLINEEPKSQNKISTITGFSIIETNTILTALELKGFIKELNGGIFVVD